MNISTMHIGFDIKLQQLNSAVFNNFQAEEKDYLLNEVTQNMIRAAINKAENTVTNIVSYQNIREYYNVLEPYIRTTQLAHTTTTGDLYTIGTLPTDLSADSFTSGLLYNGVKYKVKVAGATDLSDYGYKAAPVVGETFTCVIANRTLNPPVTAADGIYRILDDGDVDFTTVDADSNTPGLVFTADGVVGAGASLGASIEVIADTPGWDATTELVPIYNPGYNNILAVNAVVDCGDYIAGGSITSGKKYRVVTAGTTDLTGYGAPLATSSVNSIFTCSTTGTPAWADGTKLIEVKKMTCRLVQAHDVGNFLNNSFGSVRTSPIAVLADGEVKVYHNNQFTIHQIYLDYIRKPAEVSYNNSVDSDMNSSLHNHVVTLAARLAAGVLGSKEYESLVLETEKEDKSINS